MPRNAAGIGEAFKGLFSFWGKDIFYTSPLPCPVLYGDSQYDREETIVPKVTSILSVFYGIWYASRQKS